MQQHIRWGILATGKIAHTFARDLALVPGARLAAVGSRRPESAQAFAAEHGAAAAYGSYDELVADPDVDVVYIASPHALHLEHARLALRGRQARAVREAADPQRRRGRGDGGAGAPRTTASSWRRCGPPATRWSARWPSSCAPGRFGTPRHLHAELGFRVDAGPEDRMLDPALGAGALLDMGIYPLTFAHLLLGAGARSCTRPPTSPRAGSTSTWRSPAATPAGRWPR